MIVFKVFSLLYFYLISAFLRRYTFFQVCDTWLQCKSSSSAGQIANTFLDNLIVNYKIENHVSKDVV